MKEKPVHIAAGVVIRSGKVLITRRSPQMTAPGLWEFPGGKVEAGEEASRALVREIREELGLSVTVSGKLGESKVLYKNCLLWMECFHISLEREQSPVLYEHDKMVWADPDDFKNYLWAPADIPLVNDSRFLERLNTIAETNEEGCISMKNELPRWDLSMYQGFDSESYQKDFNRLVATTERLKALAADPSHWKTPVQALEKALPLINESSDIYETLESYTYCRYSTNTKDQKVLNQLNRLEEKSLILKQAMVEFNNRLAETGTGEKEWSGSETLKDFVFFLNESREEQKFQMSPKEEDLAADLSRSGGSAWSRLQETLSSSLKSEWKSGEWKTVTQLRLMASDPDRSIRQKAWQKELECWESAEISFAAALNGVKGFSHTLNSRRGYDSTLARSIRQARMAPETLDAMVSSMEESLPDFRRYMKAKACAMNLEKLSWYDIIAPLNQDGHEWTWQETREFIEENFASLSPEYAEYAKKAFRENWIDAPPAEGKVGGAYCISFPLQEESRIMTNFDGAFTDVSTIAHELGHGWHHEVLKKAPALHRGYPMTLAETASIFSEILVFQAYYAKAGEKEKTGLLESSLSDSNQVITDILSRFLFEKELMEKRGQGELSAAELKEMMGNAQEAAYGDALHPEERHPWMWAVKGHYYIQDLGFYNFPYAFGLLFGWGLYSLYEEMGKDFEPLYRKVLMMTGRATAEECAAAAGIDIRKKDFWQRSLGMIRRQIDNFCGAAEKMREE